jgi:vacuolar iron transporter family protein
VVIDVVQIPYFIVSNATTALFISIGITAVILLIFGVIKGYLTGSRSGWLWLAVSAIQTLAVGALAASASYGIVRVLDNSNVQ